MQATQARAPLILFGAFDRHNFGDLLFPHLAADAFPDRELIFAGLAARDLTAWGGHRVEAIARVAADWKVSHGEAPAHVVHVGGELLGCESYQAAIMLMGPQEARASIAQHDAEPDRVAWAQQWLGIHHRAAYVLPKSLFAHPGKFVFNGVGGASLGRRDASLRQEVEASLRAADWIGVRDAVTLEVLAKEGVEAHLVPDPAVRVAERFGERIHERGLAGEPAQLRQRFPHGYVAAQFSADFGDDATLTIIAAQLDAVAARTGLGVAFFRAGAAPWHDDLACYRAAAARMRSPDVAVFESLDLWDICALVAGSRAYCGSSLHGRIVAEAFGVAAATLVHGADPASKQRAYLDTWGGAASMAGTDGIAAALEKALQRAPETDAQARRLAEAHRAQVAIGRCLGEQSAAPQELTPPRT